MEVHVTLIRANDLCTDRAFTVGTVGQQCINLLLLTGRTVVIGVESVGFATGYSHYPLLVVRRFNDTRTHISFQLLLNTLVEKIFWLGREESVKLL